MEEKSRDFSRFSVELMAKLFPSFNNEGFQAVLRTTTMRTTTMTTTKPFKNSNNSATHAMDEEPIVVDIKKDIWGKPYYSLDAFKEKFNRTAVVRKPSEEQNKHHRTNDERSFNPNLLVPISNVRAVEHGPSPKVTTTTQYFASSLGTRNFLPALVSFVALLSLAMILVAIGKFIANRCRHKERNSTERKVEQGYWPSTFSPSAPPPDDTLEMNTHLPDVSSGMNMRLPDISPSDFDCPPPDYESLFNVAGREETINERLVTDIRTRYPSETCPKGGENSMPQQQPLLLDSARPVNVDGRDSS